MVDLFVLLYDKEIMTDHTLVNIDNTISRIKDFKATHRLSNNRLAKQAGLAEKTIRNMEDDSWNPRAETIRKLEAVIPGDFIGGGDNA